MTTSATYIIVHNLNQLRWLVPNCLITNVFHITDDLIKILDDNKIPYDYAIKCGGDYKIVK